MKIDIKLTVQITKDKKKSPAKKNPKPSNPITNIIVNQK